MATITSFPDTIPGRQAEAHWMQWLLDAATRTKLMLGFGLILLSWVAIMIAAYFGINTLSNTFHSLFDTDSAFAPDPHRLEQRLKQLVEQYQL
jgi:hypothetical protein